MKQKAGGWGKPAQGGQEKLQHGGEGRESSTVPQGMQKAR